jgi:RNA polymerase sigma factor (TIGR02999 family)
MKGERRDHTLQATALVNECFLRLMDARQVQWQDRVHFFALSARLMRRILVDVARAHRYDKRGGGAEHVPLDESVPAVEIGRDLVALDDALRSLATIDERKSQVVELRFFGGLSHEETAEILGVSAKTVMREWQVAKMWLLRELRQGSALGRSGSGR